MFNPAAVTAASFGDHLAATYRQSFADHSPGHADFLNETACGLLNHMGNSDAAYHNADHTMMVTLVGQQILLGQRQVSAISPDDWLHFILALMYHDTGYCRDVCEGDSHDRVVINEEGETICPPRGATDATLTPYHVDRGKILVRQLFGGHDFIDAGRIARAIEFTRFPVPDDPAYRVTDSEPALVRAADLIGQIADPFYHRKISWLYHEFVETGEAARLGFTSPMDLIEHFPGFFDTQVEPLIGPALAFLEMTEEGRIWVARLHDIVARARQGAPGLGPFPGPPDTG